MPEEIKKKLDTAVKELDFLKLRVENNVVSELNFDEARKAIIGFESSDSYYHNYNDKILELYQRFRDLIPKNKDYSEERIQRAERDIKDVKEYHAIIDKAKEELGEKGSKDSVFLHEYIRRGQFEQIMDDDSRELSVWGGSRLREFFQGAVFDDKTISENLPNREQVIERYRVLLEKAKQIEQKEKKKL